MQICGIEIGTIRPGYAKWLPELRPQIIKVKLERLFETSVYHNRGLRVK